MSIGSIPVGTSAQFDQLNLDPDVKGKLQRVYSRYERRLNKVGPTASMQDGMNIVMQAWREVFGCEWPETRKAG